MAEIQPFRGLRYNSRKIKLEEVITEPYDRIAPALQEEYYRRNPYNVVRIILGKDHDSQHPEKNKYKRARTYLDQWEKEGILVREDREALYLYEQEFRVRNEQKKRTGLIARVKLEGFASKKVLPHEKTFSRPKADRLNLLRATNTNTEQIFLLYKDDDHMVSQAIKKALAMTEMVADVQDEDGCRHRLWAVKDKESIRDIEETMADKVLIIADGHHRYETSLNYQKEMARKLKSIKGTEPFNYVMMTLFQLDDPGLVILPTYRVVKGLDRLSEEAFKNLFRANFIISEFEWTDTSSKSALEKAQQRVLNGTHIFAAFVAQWRKFVILQLKYEEILDREISGKKSREWKSLDVAILHSLIIDRLQELSSGPFSQEDSVSYIRNLEEGIDMVIQNEFQMIFLLKPVGLRHIREVVEKGELMPHKSTDFFPKLKSGLVMNPLNE